MSEYHSESAEIVAKEITVAVIQKLNFSPNIEKTAQDICNLYSKIYKQVIESSKNI